ncbi:MAG: hypothetical protein Q7S51_02525 [Gallionellaceae bacterium]|nr:hypothetical protein [Gallionellaceae bacterium]
MTLPQIAVTAPAASGSTLYVNSSPLNIGGTASDNVGVTQVTWVNDAGGSGNASGTTSWSASVPLQSGWNTITVKAADAAGNTNLANLIVNYSATTTDSTPPTVGAFSVNPSTNTLGQSFTISYTVSDSGGSGLKQIGLWRANVNGASNDSSWAQIGNAAPLSGNGPYSGTFTDTPPAVGNYWYGIHVIDNANPTAVVHEPTPLPVTVTATNSCTEAESNDSSYYANPLTLNVGCTGKISTSTDKDWFDIYVNSGTTITFNLQVPAGLDYDMALYGPTNTNSSQHWLKDGNLYGAGQPETITYTTTATGYFAIQIYGYAGASSSSSTYTVTGTK